MWQRGTLSKNRKLFGFKVSAAGLIHEITGFVKGLAHGEAVTAAAVVGIAGIVLILVLQRWLPKVPAVLIMVVLAIAATTIFSLADHGVSLFGVRRPWGHVIRFEDTS